MEMEEKLEPNSESKVDRSLTNIKIEGFQKITGARTNAGKILWVMLMLAAFMIAVYEVAKTISDYRNSPIVTSYNIVVKETMDFPQIYICPSNKIRKSYLEANWTHFERVEKMREIFFSKYRVPRVKRDFQDNQTLNLANNNSFEYFRQIYMDMGILQSDLFVACQFREFTLSTILCKTIVTPVMDPNYGRCYVVDVGNRNQEVPAQGLTIIFNMKSQEYPEQPEFQPKHDGLLVSIAKRFNPVQFDTVLVSPETYTKIDITKQRLKFMNVTSGQAKQICSGENDFKFEILNVTYSVPACRQECLMKTVFNTCECFMPMDPTYMNNNTFNDDNEFCSLEDISGCVKTQVVDSEVAQQKIKDCASNCHIPCETWRFNTRLSSMPLNKDAFPVLPPNTTLKDFIYLHLAFPLLEYEEFSQQPSMSVSDLFGNLGGQIGLWLGASLMTLIQIPITLFALSGYHTYNLVTPQLKKISRRLIGGNVLSIKI